MRFEDKPVYLCCGHTDMRKSINGLMTLVQQSFSLDPFADALFVFCNQQRDSAELSCLIDSARLEKKLRRNEVFERKIS